MADLHEHPTSSEAEAAPRRRTGSGAIAQRVGAVVSRETGLLPGATQNVMRGFLNVEWSEVSESERADAIQYCTRLAGSLGLELVPQEGAVDG